jgi:CheY-like chemotaxis protein
VLEHRSTSTAIITLASDLCCVLTVLLLVTIVLLPIANNSGIDAAAIMTKEGGGIKAPIIAFSADTTQEIREKCQEVGMKDFVSKPATQQTIRDVVMTYCPGLQQ